MKNKVTLLMAGVLLGTSLLMTGCPRHLHPHFPRPHHLQQGETHLGALSLIAAQVSMGRVSTAVHG